MADAVKDNWPLGELIIVPHVRRDDLRWSDIQTEAQDQIGAALQAMYAALLQQPLSPRLAKLVWEFKADTEGTQRGC
ncbi:hypothetical protein [Microvirga aerophila]|uniref:Uncharacterized protein n=1 Tax=Microvirga aerophila TaxID=670291 RepID=A0A512C493_9HYPH|nr:hypothetical protein [Microvirga aerophila]GEO19018.1 hypothetical protein MAE02_67140 [Microvirga aerophila]